MRVDNLGFRNTKMDNFGVTYCRIAILLLMCLVTSNETAPSNFIGGNACGAEPAEIFFLLDSSSSIWPGDFRKQLNFVKEVIKTFEIGPNKTRIGVSSFSYRYYENFGLNRYTSVEDIEAAVDNIPHYLGGTETYKALDGIRTRGLTKHRTRPGVARILIVLTDGESYNPKKTKEAARKVKDDGIVVFAVGIGQQTNTEELVSIASTPKHPEDKYLFEVGEFGELDDTVKRKLTIKACEVRIQADEETSPGCGARNMADVIFLVDPSEVGSFHANYVYDFIGDVTSDFNMGKDNIQVGLEYQNCGAANVSLGKYNNSKDLAKALRNVPTSGLPDMLKQLRTHSFRKENGARDRARHMAVVFVDDRLFNRKIVLDEATRTKNSDVELFVVAIGDSVVEDELKALCSSAADRHLIRVPSYENLRQSKPEFMTKFCKGL